MAFGTPSVYGSPTSPIKRPTQYSGLTSVSDVYNSGKLMPQYQAFSGGYPSDLTAARQSSDIDAARQRDAMLDLDERRAQIQTPQQRQQTELINLARTSGITRPTYEQDWLQQQAAQRASAESAAAQEREGTRSVQLRAEQESDRRAQQQAQEALMTLSANQRQAEMRLQESLMGEREGRRKAAIPGLLASVPGLDESRYETGAIDEGEEAADQAAFTSARERTGATSLSAVRALRELMAGQGLHGSSVEAAGLGNVIGDARGTVGEVARTQAVRRSQRAGQRADRDVNAKLTRRSQDISRQQALQQLILGSIY